MSPVTFIIATPLPVSVECVFTRRRAFCVCGQLLIHHVSPLCVLYSAQRTQRLADEMRWFIVSVMRLANNILRSFVRRFSHHKLIIAERDYSCDNVGCSRGNDNTQDSYRVSFLPVPQAMPMPWSWCSFDIIFHHHWAARRWAKASACRIVDDASKLPWLAHLISLSLLIMSSIWQVFSL